MIKLKALFLGLFYFAPWLHKTQSSNEACDDTSSQQKIIEWVRSNGGIFSTKQDFRRAVPGDPSSHFGIFATEDIKKGELLTSVPWKCILESVVEIGELSNYTEKVNGYFDIEGAELVLQEMRKGDESFFEPYTSYLLEQPRGKIPSDWSDAGKDLLTEILGNNDELPPADAVDLLKLWRIHSHIEDENDPLEELALIEHYTRADTKVLVPLYDLYNHANGIRNNGLYKVSWGEKQEFFASRDIQKGEEISHSYNKNDNVPKWTPDYYDSPQFLRDYGFVEPLPQRWIFHHFNFTFDLEEDENGDVTLTWITKPKKSGFNFLREQLGRLRYVAEPYLEKIEEEARREKDGESPNKSIPPHNELVTIRQYIEAVKTAISAATKAAAEEFGADAAEDINAFDDIYPPGKGMREDWFHENFYNYNMQIENKKWKIIEEDSSVYQHILWVGDPAQNDVCFLLENEPQTCSSFRAHYHDVASHFPTRYFDSVRRVAILGGGDALMLHEMMKYDTIEKVIHLELDQKVVRKSHKYFASQPFFHDERVEWWFGNAAKSLLMLPSDYFGSFDIVFVDLSESGFLSNSVTTDHTVWEMMAKLVAPEGILVKNELYQETMNELFDRTMLLHYEHVPIIMSWALSIGTNRMDLLQPNVTSMKKWDKIKTVWEEYTSSPDNFDDHFKYVHDYKRNNARAEGICASKQNKSEGTDEEPLAGVLLILEAENASLFGKEGWSTDLHTIFESLQKTGVTPTSTISHSFGAGQALGIIFMHEGVVTVRTWPKENYYAFDVQLWGAFDKLGSIKASLAKVVGSSTESLSSYRVITGGMPGTETMEEDRKKTGPKNVNFRECDEPNLKDGVFSRDTLESVIEESLQMIQDDSGVVAVLCGNIDEFCFSNDVLSKKTTSFTTLSLWDCSPGLEMKNDDEHFEEMMSACEAELLNQLSDIVSKKSKIAAFVLDDSASHNTGILANRIWRNPRNKQALLANRFTFIAHSVNQSKIWMKDFLEWRRREMVDYEHLFRAEVAMKSTNGSLEMVILSGQDPSFFGRLVNVTDSIESRTGFYTEIQEIEGGVEKLDEFQKSKWYVEDNFERNAGEAQFASQRPLAEQRVIQFQLIEGELSTNILNDAMEDIFHEYTGVKMQTVEDVGDGLVLAVVCSEGSAVLIWDGSLHVDINVFGYESETSKLFWGKMESFLWNSDIEVKLVAYDEFPRGIGRVVNLMKDLKVWKKLS